MIVASPSQSLYQLPVKRSPPDLTVMVSAAPPAKPSASVAGAADLEFLEAAEVEVAGVGARAFGRVDAFELRLVLLAEAVGEEAGLRAGARAADVVGRHLHAGRLRHRRPDVARVRDLGEQLLGEVRADRRRRRVDDGRFAGDGDRFLQRRDLQLLIDGQRLVDDDANAFALDASGSRRARRSGRRRPAAAR